MRQMTIEWYTAWINWCFDHPWVFVLGFALYVAALVVQHKYRRNPWRR